MDQLDAVDAGIVSVTKSFNTSTRMGRLGPNMLLSFAQIEPKVTAERIKHKEQVFEGQRDAIVDPHRWAKVQQRLKDHAARERDIRNGRQSSPLSGKLFHDTGDKLTPSHTSKKGKRIRCCISRRLVTRIKTQNPDAWRLPATVLEDGIGQIMSAHISRPCFLMDLVKDIAASELETLSAGKSGLAAKTNKPNDAFEWVALLMRRDLEQGKITIRLCRKALAEALDIPVDRIDNQARTFSAPSNIANAALRPGLF